MPRRPPPLGTINGFHPTGAVILGSHSTFVFDGTTLGLVTAALAAGVRVSDRVAVPTWGTRYEITPTGGGSRTPNGEWAERACS